MNQEQINRDLAENESGSSQLQSALLEFYRKRIKASASEMSKHHAQWDNNSYIYRGYRVGDKQDADAVKDGEPPKIIVPITYAQIQTALSFIMSTFAQRENLFEVRGMGPEDEKNSFALNMDLQYQSHKDHLALKLYYWALDSLKQGFGVVRSEWVEDYEKLRVSREVQANDATALFARMFGKPVPTRREESVEDVLCYQGNRITNISPYAFFPDPDVSIANFESGSFVATEEEVSLSSLTKDEGIMFFGTDKIPESYPLELADSRYRRARGPFAQTKDVPNSIDGQASAKGMSVRTEMQFNASEAQLSKMTGQKFGNDPKPVKWLMTVVNDSKIIRFEKCTYLHGRYNFNVIEFSPDHDAFFNPGLADTIFELQNIITFFLNSHITNVRKIIANRFIVDPGKVEMDDITSGRLYIRTKGVTGGDVKRVIEQLQVSDITRTHVQDMDVLLKLVQLVTGVNDNALGQFSQGRRSATEARNVNAGAAARLKMHATLMWQMGVEPLGRKYIANTRQWRTREVYDQIVGAEAVNAPYDQVILADPTRIAGGYDFTSFDATLPTDRQFQAGALQELFGLLVSNPNSMQLLNKNPMPLMEHIAKLYGIKNLSDFDLQPLMQPQAQVVPDAQAAQAAEQGTPVDMDGMNVLQALSQ